MANRLQKKWVFTLNQLDDEKLPSLDSLQESLNEICQNGVFGLETAPTTGRLHYQGRLVVRGTRISKKLLLEKLSEYYPVKGWTVNPEWSSDASIEYCKKDGIYRYLGEDQPYMKADLDFQLYPWQKDMIDIANRPFDKKTARLVWYLYDLSGGIGKSSFTKWLVCKETSLNAYKLPAGGAKQLAGCICQRINVYKKVPKLVIYDKTRTTDSDLNENAIWHVIEDIKVGLVSNPMHGKGEVATMLPPSVFVFANTEPIGKYLSFDRWAIIGVNKNKELFLDASRTKDVTIKLIKEEFPNMIINHEKE